MRSVEPTTSPDLTEFSNCVAAAVAVAAAAAAVAAAAVVAAALVDSFLADPATWTASEAKWGRE